MLKSVYIIYIIHVCVYLYTCGFTSQVFAFYMFALSWYVFYVQRNAHTCVNNVHDTGRMHLRWFLQRAQEHTGGRSWAEAGTIVKGRTRLRAKLIRAMTTRMRATGLWGTAPHQRSGSGDCGEQKSWRKTLAAAVYERNSESRTFHDDLAPMFRHMKSSTCHCLCNGMFQYFGPRA